MPLLQLNQDDNIMPCINEPNLSALITAEDISAMYLSNCAKLGFSNIKSNGNVDARILPSLTDNIQYNFPIKSRVEININSLIDFLKKDDKTLEKEISPFTLLGFDDSIDNINYSSEIKNIDFSLVDANRIEGQVCLNVVLFDYEIRIKILFGSVIKSKPNESADFCLSDVIVSIIDVNAVYPPVGPPAS